MSRTPRGCTQNFTSRSVQKASPDSTQRSGISILTTPSKAKPSAAFPSPPGIGNRVLSFWVLVRVPLAEFLLRIFDPDCRAALDWGKDEDKPRSHSLTAQFLRLAEEREEPESTVFHGWDGDAHTGLRRRNSNSMRNEARKICQEDVRFTVHGTKVSGD